MRALKFTALLSLLPNLAWAHALPISDQGFSQGFIHPLSGLDHCLAMLAVGLLAIQDEKTKTWVYPCCFLGFMLIGGIIGLYGTKVPAVELGILASVFCLGLFISLPKLLPRIILSVAIAVFAVCHGHAHGTEMLVTALAWQYATGFLLATALLHIVGIVIGKVITPHFKWLYTSTGIGILLSSFWL